MKNLTVVSLAFFSVFQTAALLTETTSMSEKFGKHLSEPFVLKALLLHHRQLGNLGSGEFNRKDRESRKGFICIFYLGVQGCITLLFSGLFLPVASLAFSVSFSFFDKKRNRLLPGIYVLINK